MLLKHGLNIITITRSSTYVGDWKKAVKYLLNQLYWDLYEFENNLKFFAPIKLNSKPYQS